MFRYGGPIKEGVMHGMKNDGSGPIKGAAHNMRNGGRTDYNFGGNVFPDMRGRVTGPGGYAGKDTKKPGWFRRNFDPLSPGSSIMQRIWALSNGVTTGIMGAGLFKDGGIAARPGYYKGKVVSKVPLLGNLYNRGTSNIKNFYETIKNKLGTTKNTTVTVPTKPSGTWGQWNPGGRTGGAEVPKSIYEPGPFLSWLGRDPTVRAAGGLYKAATGPLAKGIAGKAAQFATSATGLGLIFVGGKYLWPDGTEATIEEIEQHKQTGKRETLGGEVETIKKLTEAEQEVAQEKRLNKIYKTLGVDRAKRNAASNALIDMSQYIEKNPITKKTVSSTINAGLQAFSKRLDKVDQLKEASGLMLAKADLTNEGNSLDNKMKELAILKSKKELNQSVTSLKASFKKAQGGDYAGSAAREVYGKEYGGPLMTTKDFKNQFKKAEGTALEEDVIKQIATNAVRVAEERDGGKLPNGIYTVGDYIIRITGGKATELIG